MIRIAFDGKSHLCGDVVVECLQSISISNPHGSRYETSYPGY